jgi:hypothetical protein
VVVLAIAPILARKVAIVVRYLMLDVEGHMSIWHDAALLKVSKKLINRKEFPHTFARYINLHTLS